MSFDYNKKKLIRWEEAQCKEKKNKPPRLGQGLKASQSIVLIGRDGVPIPVLTLCPKPRLLTPCLPWVRDLLKIGAQQNMCRFMLTSLSLESHPLGLFGEGDTTGEKARKAEISACRSGNSAGGSAVWKEAGRKANLCK